MSEEREEGKGGVLIHLSSKFEKVERAGKLELVAYTFL